MAHYESLNSLRGATLKFEDSIEFPGTGLVYQVRGDHLMNITNGEHEYGYYEHIFEFLGINFKEKQMIFCEKYYGYPPIKSKFPSCKDRDFPALKRVVEALMQLSEEKQIEKLKLKTMKRKILIIDGRPDMIPRAIAILKKSHEVDVAISVDAVENLSNLKEGGLSYYDIIFFEQAMSHSKMFTLEETASCMHTGWCLYEKFMRDLNNINVVWTFPIKEYSYPTPEYPKRNWGKNVKLLKKRVGDDDYMLNFIEQCFAQ